MGSEQSQNSASAGGGSASHGATPVAKRHSMHPNHANPRPFTTGSRLNRGNTIAVSGQATNDNSTTSVSHPAVAFHSDSRPVSPPMSVCSDSDLPYISYTDRPIGDSPKLRNKGHTSAAQRNVRNSMYETSRKQTVVPKRPLSTHTIVVVRPAAAKEVGIDKDPDIQRIQKHEHSVRRRLADQVSLTNELTARLHKEQERNSRLFADVQASGCLIDGGDAASSASELSDRQSRSVPPGVFHDLRDSFNSMSPMLIQYRYDEMKYSYKRCMKNLRKKESRLKAVTREHCLVVDQLEEVMHKYREIQHRLEHVCCMYLDMFNRKEEENIPQFLPVMRASVSLPANRDPEVLERLDPAHLNNICARMQSHLNLCASKVSSEQNLINIRIKEVDTEATRVLAVMTEKQKLYASYADHFSKVRHISQQLTRCNALLHQNIECMETLNNMLDVDQRLEPFVWMTNKQ